MSKNEKLRELILGGKADANIRFDDLRQFLISLGFEERVRASHHSFRKEGIDENRIYSATAGKPKFIRLDKSETF